jgi:TolB-like protein
LNFPPHPLLEPPDLLSPEPWRPLVAVLPFTQGARPELRLLGVEIADTLRERLVRDPALRAILISSDFLAKAPPHAVDLVCRELRIGHLVSGKCHGDLRKPSLFVELTDTRDWNVRWAEFFHCGAHALLDPDSAGMTQMVDALRRELVLRPRR